MMRKALITVVGGALNWCGYELQRVRRPPLRKSDAARKPTLWQWLAATQQIRTVIDIGANRGDYVVLLARELEPKRLYAFEPLPACQAELKERARWIPGFELFPVALDERAGDAEFFVNSNIQSSSLLRVSDRKTREFPHTAGETPIRVPLARLDDVLDAGALERNVFIKMDVQGVEDRVIRGGRGVFGVAQAVLVEMSFVALYEGQPLFEEVHDELADVGLRFAGFLNQIDSTRTGQPLFAHCLYVRPASAAEPS